MNVAGAWYLSGTLWTGAGVVVAVLAAVAVVWVTLAVGFPRRRLYYGLRAAAPLLPTPANLRSDLKLRYRRKVLRNPHVLTIELVSRGRRDIPNEAYNDAKPLQLDVGSRLVEILQVKFRPPTAPDPKITFDGTSLKIGPSLIKKRQEITISVLTDGAKNRLTCRNSLVDVQVRPRSDERLVALRLTLAYTAILALVVVAAFVALWRGHNIGRLTWVLEIFFTPLAVLFALTVGYYFNNRSQ